MVIVNPAAGNGRGVRLYERDVAPVLRCAFGSTTDESSASRLEVVVTKAQGDAHAVASGLDLDAYAAVVCVGGDGTLAEVRNGLAGRGGVDGERKKSASLSAALFPVGVVPTGSGNAVAKSLAFFADEPCDAASAALAVARGGTRALDAADVFAPTNATETRLPFGEDGEDVEDVKEEAPVAMRSLLSLSWGLFADIDIESERFRWLGGARFTAQALVRILFPRKYEGAKLRFKPLDASGDGGDAERFLKNTAPRAAAARASARGAGSSVSVP